MTIQAGELVFLHQTLLEYLAARYATRTPQVRDRALRLSTRRRVVGTASSTTLKRWSRNALCRGTVAGSAPGT
jgi:hypothetical protein